MKYLAILLRYIEFMCVKAHLYVKSAPWYPQNCIIYSHIQHYFFSPITEAFIVAYFNFLCGCICCYYLCFLASKFYVFICLVLWSREKWAWFTIPLYHVQNTWLLREHMTGWVDVFVWYEVLYHLEINSKILNITLRNQKHLSWGLITWLILIYHV